MDQGRVAVAHMFKTDDLDNIAKIIPYGIYTIPEVSMSALAKTIVRKTTSIISLAIQNTRWLEAVSWACKMGP